MSQSIAYKLDHLLNGILFEHLAIWLQPKLEAVHGSDGWWRKGVYENLSDAQKRRRRNPDRGDLSELDLQALLHVVSKNFRQLVDRCGVSWDLRTPLESVRGARNALSHRRGGRSPDPEDLLLHALNTKKLLGLLSAPADAIDAADSVVKAITNPEPEHTGRSTLGDLIGGELDAMVQADHATEQESDEDGIETDSEETAADIEDQPRGIEPQTQQRLPLGADVDPTRMPLEGLNPVVTAQLRSCMPDANGIWQMGIVVGDEDHEHYTELHIPAYLSDSAQAAADILQSLAGREIPPPLKIKLLNVFSEDGALRFPETPEENGEAYPLLVVQPSYLINVTSLTHFDYCPRNYLMDRYSISESNQAMQRGALVHSVFDFMLRNPGENEGLLEHCHTEMDRQLPELTMQGVSSREHYEDVRPHLNALAQGVERALDPASFQDLYIERYMINPDLGMKGKIDALVQKKNGHWQALELKTGKSWGAEANTGHAFQVCAYHLLLSQAGIGPLDPPAVVYTGNQANRIRDGEPQLPAETMVKRPEFTAATAIEMINLRNELVRIDYTGRLDFNTNDNKCRACVRLGKAEHCINLHGMGLDGGGMHSEHLDTLVNDLQLSEGNQKRFQVMNKALLEEFQAIRIEHGQVLQSSIESRIAQGICLEVRPDDRQMGDGSMALQFPNGNSSEFREGDPCLLSDEAGPVRGNCAEVYISTIDKTHAVVSLPQGVRRLWFEPAYLDVNAPDSAFERNFAALYALWGTSSGAPDPLEPIRRFLGGDASAFRPNEELAIAADSVAPPPLPAQMKAVGLARGLKDILLIQGPPGTGKTYTLALAVKALAQDEKRIAIATYTHRAADEVMSKLESVAPDLQVRKLGRAEAVAAQHSQKCLDTVLKRTEGFVCSNRDEMLDDLESRQEQLKDLLKNGAVYIGTTHAWLSGKHDALPKMMPAGDQALFDVVVVDEASQVITPNLAGVLRLAGRWILVGDHKQLPPIVVGDTTRELEKTLFEAIAEHPKRDETLLVQLDTQHRMPSALADFIGSAFYGVNLRTSQAVGRNHAQVTCAYPLIKTDHCIALFDTGQASEEVHLKQFVKEATWVTDTLAELSAQGWPLRDRANKPTIGVIAPYRAQVALLRRSLERKFDDIEEHEFWNDVVDTVDRFQGDERDIIILSLCLRPGSERIPRIYEDERRINVALSRAKMKLWVVGCIDEMQHIPAMRAFVEFARTHPEDCTITSLDPTSSEYVGKEMF